MREASPWGWPGGRRTGRLSRDHAPVLLVAGLGLLVSTTIAMALYQIERRSWIDTLTSNARTWHAQAERRLAHIGFAATLLGRRLRDARDPDAVIPGLTAPLRAHYPAITGMIWVPGSAATAPSPDIGAPPPPMPAAARSAARAPEPPGAGSSRGADASGPVTTLIQPVAPSHPSRDPPGSIVVTLRPDILLDRITASLPVAIPALQVTDLADRDTPAVLYQHFEAATTGPPLLEARLSAGDRSWRVIASPPAGGMPFPRFSPALLALALGLSTTLFLILHQAGLRRRTRTVERHIALGAQALAETNSQLRHHAAEREKALQALTANEARYRLLTEHASDIISRQDRRGVITYASPASRTILGYDADQLVGRHALRLVRPQDRPAVRERLQAIRAGDGTGTLTLRVRRRDGEDVWLETTVHGVLPCDGCGPGDSVSISRDISARMEAQRALRHSEQLFRRVFENVSVGMTFFSPASTRFLRVNHALASMLGYSTAELEEMSVADITHPADAHVTPSEMQQVLSGVKDSFVVEKRYLHKNGSTVWILGNTTLIRTPDGEPRFFISQIQDISERKHATQRLAELSHQQDLILNATDEGIYGVDADGRATFVNRMAALMLGFDPGELIGRHLHARIRPATGDGPHTWNESRIFHSIRDRATHYVDDEVFRHRDGHLIPVQYVSSPIIDRNRATGAVVVFSRRDPEWLPDTAEARHGARRRS